MSPLPLLLGTWLGGAALMAVLWLVQQRRRDAGIADVGWAAGLALAAVVFAVAGPGDAARRALMATLAGLWGLRLAWHLLADRVLGSEEDGRYRRMREHWGQRAALNFFPFFQAQALFIALFCVPFLSVAFNARPALTPWDLLAIAVFSVSVVGETAADRQLRRFRRNPANRVKACRDGLWRFSRHPNYFFEWLHWWTYVLLGVGSPWWADTHLGPVLMLQFLFRLTGIPYTEQQALVTRGSDYREYQRTTSVFIPWFPKRSLP